MFIPEKEPDMGGTSYHVRLKTNARIFLMVLATLLALITSMTVLTYTDNLQADVQISGTCGENLTYYLDVNGTLTISGTGNMYDYDLDDNLAPWNEYIINKLVVEDGVTSIGAFAFYGVDLESAYMPNIKSIGNGGITTFSTPFTVFLSEGEHKSYYFTPATNGTIRVYSSGSYDTYGYLYDSYGYQLTSNDDGGNNNNFSYSYDVCAGTEYRIDVRFYSSETSGSFTLNMSGVSTSVYSNESQSLSFYGCNNLKQITVPIDVIIYSNNAFSGCNSLSQYNLTKECGNQPYYNNNGSYLPWNMYSGNIEKIHIDEDVETINEYILRMNLYDYDGEESLEKSANNLAGHSLVPTYNGFKRVSDPVHIYVESIGAVVSCPTTTTAGTEVHFTVDVANGYSQNSELSVSVNGYYGEINVTTSESGYSFIAPGYDVTISVSGAVPETYGIIPHMGEGHSLSVFNGNSMPISSIDFGEPMTVFIMFSNGYAMGEDFELTVEGIVLENPLQIGYGFYAYYFDAPSSTDGILDIYATGIEQYVSHNVICFVDGKSSVYPVRDGYKMVVEDPVKAGKRFVGWYMDPSYTAPFDMDTEVTEDLVLYAKFVDSFGYGNWWILYTDGVLDIYKTISIDSVPWADHMADIRSVHLPDNLTTICEGAFEGCTRLSEITFPDTVRSIGASAFKDCSSLTSISLPDAIVTIGSRAFYGCSSLTSVAVPDCAIGEGAFSACSSLERLEGAHKGIMDGILIIEDGKVLTCVSKAVSVTLPYSVTAIGEYAFDGCTDLTYLFIPSTVTTLNSTSFDGILFKDIEDNESFVSIGIYRGEGGILTKQIPTVYHATFMFGIYSFTLEIDEMERLEAPPVIPDLPGKKFLGWEGFTDKMVVNENLVFEATYRDITSTDKTYVTVTVIRNDGVTEEYETEKGTNFRGPFSLYYTDVNRCNEWPINRAVENDMTLYAVAVLSGTYGVQWSLDLSTGVFTLSGNGYMTNYGKYTPWYDYRPYILKVTVDPGVRSISDYAFYGCKNLYDVTIADTVTSIGYYAFYHDYALEHVKLDGSNISYGSKAFTGVFFHNYGSFSTLKWASCSGKEFVGGQGDLYCVSIGRTLSETVKMRLVLADKTLTFYGTGDIPDYGSTLNTPWYTYRYDIEHIVVDEGITSVPDAAFYKYTSVKTIVLADSVTSVGKNSLRGCTSLTEIVFGSGLQTIGSNALTGYTFATSDGTALKVSPKNMAGHTFHNDGGTFVRD